MNPRWTALFAALLLFAATSHGKDFFSYRNVGPNDIAATHMQTLRGDNGLERRGAAETLSQMIRSSGFSLQDQGHHAEVLRVTGLGLVELMRDPRASVRMRAERLFNVWSKSVQDALERDEPLARERATRLITLVAQEMADQRPAEPSRSYRKVDESLTALIDRAGIASPEPAKPKEARVQDPTETDKPVQAAKNEPEKPMNAKKPAPVKVTTPPPMTGTAVTVAPAADQKTASASPATVATKPAPSAAKVSTVSATPVKTTRVVVSKPERSAPATPATPRPVKERVTTVSVTKPAPNAVTVSARQPRPATVSAGSGTVSTVKVVSARPATATRADNTQNNRRPASYRQDKIVLRMINEKLSRDEERELLSGLRLTGSLSGKIPVDRDECPPELRRMVESVSRSVRGLLEDRDPTVRLLAVRTTGSLKDREAIEELIELLDDTDKDIREAAAASLTSITGKSFGVNPDKWREWASQAAGSKKNHPPQG